MAHGTHDFEDDPRNERILIWVNGELVPREQAVVSVFDAGFVLGDGVWEGLRVRAGHPAFLEQHLDRLFEGAKAIVLDIGLSREELTEAIYSTLRANDMTDGVHVRLMVTRGVKRTPYQDPRVTIGPATVVIIAEHKEPLPATVSDGITLFTDARAPRRARHARPQAQRALQAQRHHRLHPGLHRRRRRGADARPARLRGDVQLDALLRRGRHDDAPEVLTSDGRYCLAGITRANVLEVCRAHGIPARETTFSLTDVYARPRGVRHRHLRRRRAGPVRGRSHDRRRAPRADGRAPSGAVPRPRRRRRGGTRRAVSDLVRVAMWSGPRNISTAMMRAWENRPDTVVVDEPLYAAYLARTGHRPPGARGRHRLPAHRPRDGGRRSVRAAAAWPPHPLRQTHGAPRVPDMDLAWTLRLRNVLLIRDPAEVVASYVRSRETCEPDDIGLPQQGWLQELWDEHDIEVPIIDASDFLRAPEAHLRWLCDWLGIPFTARMLSWPPGPRRSDGVWAAHWYAAVWSSTGFEPWRPRQATLSGHDAAVADACRPIYAALHARRARV